MNELHGYLYGETLEGTIQAAIDKLRRLGGICGMDARLDFDSMDGHYIISSHYEVGSLD